MISRKKSNLIKKHEYPGGKKELSAFIQTNLIYPTTAIKNKKEGRVLIEFEIGFDGTVNKAKVLNGIGDGCDEEALRLVKLLKYAPQNNHGVKVITTQKIKINFKLPIEKKVNQSTKLAYNITTKNKDKNVNEQHKNIKSYSYTIKF